MTEEQQAIVSRIKEIFLDTFTDDDFQFSIELDSDDLEEWDSLAHIRLLTAIESEFGIEFDISEIEQLTSVVLITEALANKTP